MTQLAESSLRYRRPRASLVLLRMTLLLHAVLVVAQPILAGYFLSGDVDAMAWHSAIGSSLFLIAMLQLIAAVLYWRPGGGRLWPGFVTLGLIVAELAQVVFGYSQNFAIHVPLGTAIVITVVWMTVWSFRSSARRGRPEVKQ
jgi:cytochrome b561